MSRLCLVGVQGPLQLCAGLIAMEWYGLIKRGSAEAEAVLLLYDFLVAPEQEGPIVEAIMQIASAIKWQKIVFIGGEEMNEINLTDRGARITKLKNKIGTYDFDEIFLARNYIGMGSTLILNSYPKATRVAYGDGFGLVGTQIFTEVFSSNIANLFGRFVRVGKKVLFGQMSVTGIYNRIQGVVKRKLNIEVLPLLPFDAAVLVLPIDYSGVYLDHIPLYVPSREHLLNVLDRINIWMPELNEYCLDLIKNITGDCYLYLFISPTESGCTSLSNEVAMYLETIRENSPRGTTIFIKLHPRKPVTFANYLLADLKDDYNTIIINQRKFKSIPVEFWIPLIMRCKIVSFSSSSLSLKYIYNKNVITGFSVDRIRKYFFKKSWVIFEDDYYLWREAVEALKTWDGKSILWRRGKINRVLKNG